MPTSWLEMLTSSTRNLEPPERYFWWAGLSTIASIVKKNVLLNRFSYVLYPNIYVILVSARSGLRKGIPMSYAKGILRALDCTRVVSGQNSLPDIINDLGLQVTSPKGTVFSEAQALLLAPELDAFLIKDADNLTTLTDLYDTHAHEDGWKKGLKSGKANLKNPCINMLGASNEVLFEDMIQQKDIHGGFLARTFIVHESKRRSTSSLMWAPEGLISREDLAKPLERLITLSGVFNIPEHVKHCYDDWYKNISDSTFEDPTGTIDRIGDSVLKVAMLISLSKDNSLEIREEDLELAIKKCEETLIGSRKMSFGGKTEINSLLAGIVNLLLDQPDQTIERAILLRKLGCEPIQLDRALDTLIQREALEEPFRKRNENGRPMKGIWYRMTKFAYEQYTKIRKDIP